VFESDVKPALACGSRNETASRIALLEPGSNDESRGQLPV
jgi:hypothetical protein